MASRRPTKHQRTVIDQFREFVRAAGELADTRLVQQGFQTELVIRAGGAPSWSVTTPMPDEDDFRSMLLALRPFLSKDEDVAIDGVYNLLELWLTDVQLVVAIRQSRESLADAKKGADLKTDLSPGQIADAYLNGRYFHRDSTSQAVLDALDPETTKLYRYFLHQYAIEAIRQVAATSNIIEQALSRGALRDPATAASP